MRLAGLIAAAVLALACSTPASAQSAPPPALGPGEILLEVDTVGTFKSPPDRARIYVVVKSKGESAAKARAANAALIQRVRAAAQSAGVAPGDVRPSTRGWRLGFIGNEAFDASLPAAMRVAGETETSTLEIHLKDASRVEAVRAAVEQAGADQVTGPVYDLAEDSAAHRAAKQDAVSRARLEADDYARALGMRVVRILRVSERVAPSNPEDMDMMYVAMGLGGASADEIETRIRIAIDFALAKGP